MSKKILFLGVLALSSQLCVCDDAPIKEEVSESVSQVVVESVKPEPVPAVVETQEIETVGDVVEVVADAVEDFVEAVIPGVDLELDGAFENIDSEIMDMEVKPSVLIRIMAKMPGWAQDLGVRAVLAALDFSEKMSYYASKVKVSISGPRD